MAASHSCSPDSPALVRIGLHNLSNTCYFNAAIQCLAHTPVLAAYFREKTYEREINYSNTLGTRGRLATAFAELLDRMWSTESFSISPADLKQEIGYFAGQFKGVDQHDSQELLSYLLDGLHEDLNKATTQGSATPASEGISEQEQAEIHWKQHFERNNSIISAEMHGQYRSQVTCMKCRKTSVKFDPFLMLSVEIPPPSTSYEVRLVPGQFGLPARVFAFLFPGEVRALHLKAKIAECLINPLVDLVLCEMDKEAQSIRPISDFTRLQAKYTYFAYQTDPEESESCIPVLISLLREDRSLGYSRSQPATAPRLLLLRGNSTLEETHLRVFEAVRPVLRLGFGVTEGDIMDVDVGDNEAEQMYKRLYEAKTSNRPNSLYSLRVINYNRHWNYCRPGSETCPYCQAVHFHSCLLPFSSTFLSNFIQNQDKSHYFHLEVVCPQGLFDQKFWMKEESDSVVEVTERLLEQEKDNSVSLEECLEFTCKEKGLGEEDLWLCPLCKEDVESSKKMTLYRLPRTLLIHLKRFHESSYLPTKTDKMITFPLFSLNLSAFSDLPNPPLYDLYAVIEHSGSLSYGHYTAQCKDEEGWARYDDDQVIVMREQEVVTQHAYVLFYRARD